VDFYENDRQQYSLRFSIPQYLLHAPCNISHSVSQDYIFLILLNLINDPLQATEAAGPQS
jgi:hypothetical protein